MNDYIRIDELPPYLKALKAESPTLQVYKKDNLQIFVADEQQEFLGKTMLCKHLSISHPDHYPTWDEIYEARYRFMPRDLDGYMILPKKTEYVNIHPNCFHIWLPLI